MRVERSSELERPAPIIAELLFNPETMRFLLRPVVRLKPRSPEQLPARWDVGRYQVSMWLLGFIPLGRQDIVITEIVADPGSGRWGLRPVRHPHPYPPPGMRGEGQARVRSARSRRRDSGSGRRY